MGTQIGSIKRVRTMTHCTVALSNTKHTKGNIVGAPYQAQSTGFGCSHDLSIFQPSCRLFEIVVCRSILFIDVAVVVGFPSSFRFGMRGCGFLKTTPYVYTRSMTPSIVPCVCAVCRGCHLPSAHPASYCMLASTRQIDR